MSIEYDDLLNLQRQRVESRVIQRRPVSLRDRFNLLEAYDEVNFYYRFRVKIEGFLLILQAVEPLLSQYRKQTNSPLSPVQQLSVAQRLCRSLVATFSKLKEKTLVGSEERGKEFSCLVISP